MAEIYRDIPNYEGYYQVSDKGNVRSVDRIIKYTNGRTKTLKSTPIKTRVSKTGYAVVLLNKNNTKKSLLVHRLVAIAFIPNLTNQLEVNHLNGLKTDNRVENLEWCFRKHNVSHAYATALQKSKLNKNQVSEIKQLIMKGLSQRAVGRMFGVSHTNIQLINNGVIWGEITVEQ